MTKIDVDPQSYYDASARCNEAAVAIYTAYASAIGWLKSCGGMAGTFDNAQDWAKSYDERATTILKAFDDSVRALENYSDILRQAGLNHATANSNADMNGGPPPDAPPLPSVMPGCTPAFPPSAGGPGNGLVDDGLGLAAEVGIPVPDGDTEKLDYAARVWSYLASGEHVTEGATKAKAASDLFADVTSPEVEFVLDDLEQIQSVVEALQGASAEMATSCTEYKTGVDELRKQLEGILNDLAVELAVTAAIAIAASFITFGLGAAAGAAKSAHTISKFARIVKDAVVAWKAAKNIQRGVKAADDLKGIKLVIERLKTLGKKVIDKAKVKPPKENIDELFKNGSKPKASELEDYARSEGWTRTQTPNGPAKYIDENGVERLVIKRGSSRTPGSENPHISVRDANNQRIDPTNGNPVTRNDPGNHTAIDWDLP